MSQSYPNGKYVGCPYSPMRHPQPLAVPIMNGQKRSFWRCMCGGNGFMPPDWRPTEGLSVAQAQAMGFLVVGISLPAPAPVPAPAVQTPVILSKKIRK